MIDDICQWSPSKSPLKLRVWGLGSTRQCSKKICCNDHFLGHHTQPWEMGPARCNVFISLTHAHVTYVNIDKYINNLKHTYICTHTHTRLVIHECVNVSGKRKS